MNYGRGKRVVLLVLLGAALPRIGAAPAAQGASGGIALRVSGAVVHRLSLTIADLQALPATEARWERDGQPHRAKGVDVMALVERAGLKVNPLVKNESLRFAVVAQGRDGYQAVFSLGELSPKLGGKGAVVAWEQDGAPLPGQDAPLKFVAAGDQAPSRWVRDLVELSVVGLDTTHRPQAPNHLAP